ncbi:uncharacterized protein LOC131891762 [Tigriopus californicus]|uniref:uncharacterized protein LOC131891762 n=1 Tax=Tigriopus californicus TaxID=6832 RepID=UPI0027DA93C0|nr:uncharacterized protein LOC131891762 [Tigriopus californicus]
MTSQLRLASLVVLALWSTCLLQGTLGVGLHSRGSGQFRYNKTDVSREGKVLSLFNIVKFKNSACQSIDPINGGGGGSSTRNGTCFTSDECTKRGGTPAGKCAAGFGVCCIFFVSTSGGVVTQNCSYIRNPNFPKSYDENAQVSYTIQKCDPNVCSLRLDFETFTITGTGNTVEIDTNVTPALKGGVCKDTFTVSVNTGDKIPTICGQNTGQHIYIDIGTQPSDTADIKFSFDGADTIRQWEIKVTQLFCNSPGHPTGTGCLQYHTGEVGRFTTFNFLPTNDNHLANQDYTICIRQEPGFCCIEYSVCPDPFSFTLDIDDKSDFDTKCQSDDYIFIDGGQGFCANGNVPSAAPNKFCGNMLNPFNSGPNVPLCDCTAPFQVGIFTDDDVKEEGTENPNEKRSRGVCLNYRQVPC